MRTGYSALFAATLLIFSPNLPASTQASTVKTSSATASRHIWVAEEGYRIFSSQNYDAPVLLNALISIYKANPSTQTSDALSKLHSMQAALDDGLKIRPPASAWQIVAADHDFQDGVNLGLSVISTFSPDPEVKFGAIAGKALFDKAARDAEGALGNSAQDLYGGVESASTFNRFPSSQFLYQQLETAQLMGSKNPAFANVLAALGYEDPKTQAAELIAKHPDFADHQVLQTIQASLGPEGFTATIDALLSSTAEMNSALNEINSRSIDTAIRLTSLQRSFDSYLADQWNRQIEIDNQAARRQFDALTIQGASSSVYILSTLIGFADPKVGRAVGIAGNAAVQVADAFSKYSSAMAILDKSSEPAVQNLGAALGGAVLTGNLLSAGLQVFSLFGHSQQSPELAALKQIQQQLQDLSNQIRDFQTEVSTRFDQVDSRLDLINNTLVSRLGYIDFQLGTVTQDIGTIRSDLTRVGADLRTLEQDVLQAIQVGFRRPLLEAIGSGIGWRDHYHYPMPYYPDFINYETLFWTWATIHAADIDETGPLVRSYRDVDVADELAAYDLATNIDYLKDYPLKFGLPSLSPDRLVNSTDWATASAAYVRLMTEWPEHARRGAFDADLQSMLSAGSRLQTAIRNITVDPSTGGANWSLFDALIGKGRYSSQRSSYLGNGQIFADQVAISAGNYAIPLSHGVATGLDLWAGPDQPTSYLVAATQVPIPPMSDFNGTHGANPPGNLGARIANAIKLTEYLQLGTVSLTFHLDASWYPPYYYLPKCSVGVARTMHITGTISGYVVFDRVGGFCAPHGSNAYPPTSDEGWDCFYHSVNCYLGSLGDWQNDVNGVRSKFMDNSVDLGSSYYLNNLRSQILQVLLYNQRLFYQQTSDRLSISGPLRDAAAGISGSRSALEAFLELGMSRSIESNEYLRSLLAGQRPLLDAAGLKKLIDDAVYAGYQNPWSEVKIDFASEMGASIADLSNTVDRILARVDLNEDDESSPLVENTIDKLRMMKQLVAYPVATDVTSTIRVIPGLYRRDPNTGDFLQSISLTNHGQKTYYSLFVALDDLSSNAGAQLMNGAGTTLLTQPAGSPYVQVSTGSRGLRPGDTAYIRLRFGSSLDRGIPDSPPLLERVLKLRYSIRVLADSDHL